MANPVLGKDVWAEVYSDVAAAWVSFIDCAEGLALSFEPELINITTVGLGRGVAFKERRRGWVLNITGISEISSEGRTAFTTVGQANINATYQIRVTFEDQLGNTAVFTGNVLLEAGSLTAGSEAFADFDMSFRGIGVYTLVQTIGGGGGGSLYNILLENDDVFVLEDGYEILQENG